MIEPLDPVEVRVLGSLMEKEITTPEYYPLTVNALVAACNQKSNRDPVVAFDEDTVSEAIDRLRDKRLMGVLTGGGNRVPKHSHRLGESLNFGRREMAVLCELMVRGPQTPGELRERAGRMHRFSDSDELESLLRQMEGRALVVQLPRQPGRKESRYAHLLSGPPDLSAEAATPQPGVRSNLEQEVATLRTRVDELERMFLEFQHKFD